MFTPIGFHVNEKEKKYIKISIFKISKIPIAVLSGPLGKKIRKSLKTSGCDL